MSYIQSVFAEEEAKVFRFGYEVHLLCDRIAGGVPNNDRVVEGWLRKKMGMDDNQLLQDEVARVLITRTEAGEVVTKEDAVEEVIRKSNINGFRHDPITGIRYIEGRQAKAALKEAVSVAVAAGNLKATGWGETKKWITNFFPEHCFVEEDELYLGQLSDPNNAKSRIIPVTEVTGIAQRFVQTRFGSSISYEEYVDGAVIVMNLICDYEFTGPAWRTIWVTGQQQGIGASRSQGFGRYRVIHFEQTRNEPKEAGAELLVVKPPAKKAATKKAAAVVPQAA
jgi:hypothetical protein